MKCLNDKICMRTLKKIACELFFLPNPLMNFANETYEFAKNIKQTFSK